jgi:hypothetical protein
MCLTQVLPNLATPHPTASRNEAGRWRRSEDSRYSPDAHSLDLLIPNLCLEKCPQTHVQDHQGYHAKPPFPNTKI